MNAKLREKAKRCEGCTENFYNGNNPMAVKMCWHLPTAKLVDRVRVYIDARPPWPKNKVRVYQCRHEHRVVLMSIESYESNRRAFNASLGANEQHRMWPDESRKGATK